MPGKYINGTYVWVEEGQPFPDEAPPSQFGTVGGTSTVPGSPDFNPATQRPLESNQTALPDWATMTPEAYQARNQAEAASGLNVQRPTYYASPADAAAQQYTRPDFTQSSPFSNMSSSDIQKSLDGFVPTAENPLPPWVGEKADPEKNVYYDEKGNKVSFKTDAEANAFERRIARLSQEASEKVLAKDHKLLPDGKWINKEYLTALPTDLFLIATKEGYDALNKHIDADNKAYKSQLADQQAAEAKLSDYKQVYQGPYIGDNGKITAGKVVYDTPNFLRDGGDVKTLIKAGFDEDSIKQAQAQAAKMPRMEDAIKREYDKRGWEYGTKQPQITVTKSSNPEKYAAQMAALDEWNNRHDTVMKAYTDKYGKGAVVGTVAGEVGASVFAPARALRPEVTIKDISGAEWVMGAAQVALFVAPVAGGAVGGVAGNVLSKGIQLGAGAVFLKDTVDNWDSMTPTERAVSVAMDTLIIGSVVPGSAYKAAGKGLVKGGQAAGKYIGEGVSELRANPEAGYIKPDPRNADNLIRAIEMRGDKLSPELSAKIKNAALKVQEEGAKAAETKKYSEFIDATRELEALGKEIPSHYSRLDFDKAMRKIAANPEDALNTAENIAKKSEPEVVTEKNNKLLDELDDIFKKTEQTPPEKPIKKTPEKPIDNSPRESGGGGTAVKERVDILTDAEKKALEDIKNKDKVKPVTDTELDKLLKKETGKENLTEAEKRALAEKARQDSLYKEKAKQQQLQRQKEEAEKLAREEAKRKEKDSGIADDVIKKAREDTKKANQQLDAEAERIAKKGEEAMKRDIERLNKQKADAEAKAKAEQKAKESTKTKEETKLKEEPASKTGTKPMTGVATKTNLKEDTKLGLKPYTKQAERTKLTEKQETKTITGLKEDTRTDLKPENKPEIKPSPKPDVKPEDGVHPPTPPPKPPEVKPPPPDNKPPKEEEPEKGKDRVFVSLGDGKSDKSYEPTAEEIKNSTAIKMGIGWWLRFPNGKLKFYKELPEGVENVKAGKGSAYESVQTVAGKPIDAEFKIGTMNVIIKKPTHNTGSRKVEFKPDGRIGKPREIKGVGSTRRIRTGKLLR